MPQRPRSHQLETETRTAFEALLPSAWVYRSTSPDYGLDGEVEVFDAGRATGQRFAVQLKGTDQTGTSALRIRLKAATCDYYRSLDAPVLIVRYLASTGSVYVQWFHAIDYQPADSQTTVTVRLQEEDRWSDETPARLVRGFEAFRWVRRPALELPVPIGVIVTTAELAGLPGAEWRRRIREVMRRVPGLLSAPAEGDLALAPSIELGPTQLRVNLLDIRSVAIPLAELESDARLAALPADALIVLAVAFGEAGHVSFAARLALEFASESVLLREGSVAAALADAFARDHRVVDALELSDLLKERGDEFLVASWLLDLAALRVSDALSGREAARYRERLERIVGAAEEAGDDHAAAIAHYNLANHLRGRVLPREVFHHYRRAAQLHPPYRDYEYWRREVAGTLFEGDRYQAATFFYEQAQAAGSERIDGLLGDALLFSGRYDEARVAYERAAEDPEQAQPEWILKAWALNWARASGYPANQVRDVAAANELASAANVDSATATNGTLDQALAADFLCALAWFNRGVMHFELGNGREAFPSFLLAALWERYDVEAWANALAVALNDSELHESLSVIAQAAYHLNGDRMLEQLGLFAEGQGDGFPRDEFLDAMEQVLRSRPVAAPVGSEELPSRPAHVVLDVDSIEAVEE